MIEDRVHRTLSADGTEIAGRVYGQGPPLMLLPAGPGESETCWRFVLPFLSERFTCYLMNTRGRGLSANHPDHAPERLVEDVVAFAESIGEPVGLVGWGDSLWAFVAAAHPDTAYAVATYEPGVDEVMSEEIANALSGAFVRMVELAAADRLADAAQAFIDASHVLYGEEELAGGMPADFWRAAAPNIPLFLQETDQLSQSREPSPTAPSVLTKVRIPVLLLRGAQTIPWFRASVHYVADRVELARIREIAGAAHFGPHTHPAVVANEMIRFFTSVRR